MEENYYKQSILLVKCLPFISKYPEFSLKGGTAINLFFFEMPRLSVDIDLVFNEIKDRESSLLNIKETLMKIKADIERFIPNVRVKPVPNNKNIFKLFVVESSVTIKIEVNEVLRGVVYNPKKLNLIDNAQKVLDLYVGNVNVSSFEDVFSGKICAALDRQHPRDLFDIFQFYTKYSINRKLMDCFLVYLISCSRPINELLDPTSLKINHLYENEFLGMTSKKVTLDDLYKTRDKLVADLHKNLTDRDKDFLISVKSGTPKWDLCNIKNANMFPAVKWKVNNINKMDPIKLQFQLDKLKKVLKINK